MSDKRRNILLGAFAIMVVLTIGDQLWKSLYQQPINTARRKTERLTRDVLEARQMLKRYTKQQTRLIRLRNGSLPNDVEAARTLYQGWLNDLTERIDLEQRRVDSNPPRVYLGYRVLPFSLRCHGTLEQLTFLLYEFYRAPFLHHIRTMTITPVAGTRQLSLNFALESLSIDDSPTTGALPSGQSDQLASNDLRDYQSIVRRNVFSASGGVEAAQFTILTGIVTVDGYPQAWFTNSLEDDIQKVSAGDTIRVGGVECAVERMTLRDLILVIDDQRWLLTINDRVADAIALPPEY